MKSLLLLCVLFVQSAAINAQASGAQAIQGLTPAANTYAIVVGISKYENSALSLEYADRDAKAFADYLQSTAGGNVPASNVILLLNENATYPAIYNALDSLLGVCKKDDLVYFYFSGHGDVENNTIYKLGFLLSYNTPRTNYINNAVRIDDLNDFANTLSVKVNAKVILITDACHSGKLAGNDYRGTFLVGDQLRTVQNKEIRITSCAPDQLSAEDAGWGGGRGVFSYYLVNGLKGMADADKNKTVTVNEIRNYLDSSLSADALLAQRLLKQSPVIKGNNDFKLARVDNNTMAALLGSAPLVSMNAPIVQSMAPLPMQPQAYFFKWLQGPAPEEKLDFFALNKFTAADIPFACLQMMKDSIAKAIPKNKTDSMQVQQDTARVNTAMNILRQNKDAAERFNTKLVEQLDNRGKEIIGLYLDGDAAELERRRYYNSRSNGYDVYPQLFSVALKLTPPKAYMYHVLNVKLHYFAGVAARLKIPTVEDPTALIDTALAEQQKAFALEENAAYIENELGVLYLLKKQPGVAEKHFLRATQISPQWAIPWANLAGLYTIKKETYQKAAAAVKTAMDLQPGFQGTYIVKAVLNEKKGLLLSAEELYRKSIQLNSRHYLPFERLGYVYMNTTQYAMADSFFYEADKRKKGFHFKPEFSALVSPMGFIVAPPFAQCPFDSADVGPRDVMGHFVWAMREYKNRNIDNAEKKFKQVIALDKTNPLAFHYLGKLLYEQKRWEEAAIIFNYAIDYFLDTGKFNAWCNKILAENLPQSKSRDCINGEFRLYAYDGIDDHYFAGRMYEHWSHFGEAEAEYKKIITLQPHFIGGHYLLWNMLEKMGRYKDAELSVRNFMAIDTIYGQNELNSFYQRMTTRFSDGGDWFYKAGDFLYSLSAANPSGFSRDRKKITPDEHKEVYIELFDDRDHQEPLTLPATLEQIQPAPFINYPRTMGITYLKKADSLLTADEEALADINYKLGDLFVWQGLPENAAPHYKKSIDLKPGNANTRLKLVDVCDVTYQFAGALEQLDSLYSRHEINFDKQLLMAKYSIHESRFTEADVLLKDAKQIHPYRIPAIADLSGRLQLLLGNLQPALAFYKDYLTQDSSNCQTMYSIARIYAQTGDKSMAWKWLQMAMEKGFRYGWVLQFDPAWHAYRGQVTWADLHKRYPARTYKDSAAP